jgi:hypothetical protein
MTINQPGGHLDHMIRQTRMNLVQLSYMADIKASMLLTVASLVMTLAARHLSEPDLRPGILVLTVFCLITVVLATYAAMPKLPMKRAASAADVQNPMFNLLFFGDFSRLGQQDFENAMETMMNDPSNTYAAQLRDIYTLGCFLAASKYRFVRWAYLSFMIGLFVTAAVVAVTGWARFQNLFVG